MLSFLIVLENTAVYGAVDGMVICRGNRNSRKILSQSYSFHDKSLISSCGNERHRNVE
jgi:hypothetical protein